MNKSIVAVLLLLFMLMLLTALSMVWLKDLALSSIGGISVIITLLCLHDIYVIKARKRNRYERIWKQIEYQRREKQLQSEELFQSYDYYTRDWTVTK